MFNIMCKKCLPCYIRLWPSWFWVAFWSTPTEYPSRGLVKKLRETHWQALRITIRYGVNHSKVVAIIKGGSL